MIRIGTSGWDYAHWVGIFYPEEMPEREYLAFYSRHFETVEINRSFYRLPSFDNFAAWASQVEQPSKFCFAVKGSRYITHFKKLNNPTEPVELLLSSAAGLGSRLGPILFQLPPNWKANPDRLRGFIGTLPTERRVAFEFRHPSWFKPEIAEILDEAGCTSVYGVGGGHPTPADAPLVGRFRYVRVHGGANGVGLTDDELEPWADCLAVDCTKGRDAYVYFNNDPGGFAIWNAIRLRELLADRC
jgi:uncharacterized protein YecE (DUF72 family)